MIRWFLLPALLLALMLTMATAYVGYQVLKPLQLDQAALYEVKSGSNLKQFLISLQSLGVLESELPVYLVARLTHKGIDLNAGEYQLLPGMTGWDLLLLLNQGNVYQHSFTIIEGWTVKELLSALSDDQRFTHQLAPDSSFQQLTSLVGMSANHPEGWFAPDTYYFTRHSDDVALLTRAYRRQQEILSSLWESRAAELPYDSAYQALIMASVVEKETGTPLERNRISGVFVRRLQRGMRLQTDPTVIYGMGNKYQGNITRKDLEAHTAYNTYRISGLPPTPIALPGEDAIYAAMHPESGDALYFVAKGDGSHFFSSSLEQHNQAVRQFQWRRNPDYQSAPK